MKIEKKRNHFLFDFISPEITLFYRGKEKHSSFFSTIISILILILIIFLIIYLSKDFLFKKNPTSFTYNTYVDKIHLIPFNSTGILHYINIYNTNDKIHKIDKRAFQIIGLPVNDLYFYLNNYEAIKFDHWIYSYCDEKDLIGINSNLIIEAFSNNSLCIKEMYNKTLNKVFSKNENGFEYPSLKNGTSNINGNFYGVYIMKCQNNSINNYSCYSNEEINYKYNEFYSYSINFIDNLVKINEYKEPYIPFFHSISNAFNKESFTFNHLNFHLLQIKTHEGIILDIESNKNSYKFDFNEKLININNEKLIFGVFYFWVANKMDIYERNYKKLQDISGSINGIIEIILLLVRTINSFLFHEFRTLKDFNIELEENINIKPKKNNIKKSVTSFKENYLNNNIVNIIKKPSLFNNNYIQESSIIQINLYESKFTMKMASEFKKLSRFRYYLGLLHIKQNKYVNFLTGEREKILSEENIIRNYFTLKNLKQNVGGKNVDLNEFNLKGNIPDK